MEPFYQVIRELRIANKKARRNRDLMMVLDPFLIPGRYKSTISYDCIYHSKMPPKIGSKTFSSKNTINGRAKTYIKLYSQLTTYTVKKKSANLFNGSEVIISSAGTEYKIFDFVKKQVLTIYKSQQKLKTIENNKINFSDVYPVPNTLEVNDKQSFIIEEYIDHHNFAVDTAFRELILGLRASIEKFGVNDYIDEESFKKPIELFTKRFGASDLLGNMTGGIKSVSHGDFWSSNVIFDGKTYFVTDYERVGERYFLYDFFTFIFSEWLLNGDAELLDLYFLGEYDEPLIGLFQAAKERFYIHKRKEYFLAFLVAITYERWQNYHEIDNKIKELLNIYIPEF